MMARRRYPDSVNNRQGGAVAIEFALIFPVFFILIYAIAAYSLAFLTVQNFTYASEEILRVAIACEDCETAEDWEAHIQSTIDGVSPGTGVVNGVDDSGNATIPALIHFADADELTTEISCIESTEVICELSFSAVPRLQSINLPGLGPMPSLPESLVGKASLLM